MQVSDVTKSLGSIIEVVSNNYNLQGVGIKREVDENLELLPDSFLMLSPSGSTIKYWRISIAKFKNPADQAQGLKKPEKWISAANPTTETEARDFLLSIIERQIIDSDADVHTAKSKVTPNGILLRSQDGDMFAVAVRECENI